jgi:hypothetical protein
MTHCIIDIGPGYSLETSYHGLGRMSGHQKRMPIGLFRQSDNFGAKTYANAMKASGLS